jgi:hypothetical protein
MGKWAVPPLDKFDSMSAIANFAWFFQDFINTPAMYVYLFTETLV